MPQSHPDPGPAQLSLSALVREYVLPYNTLFAISGVVAFALGLISPVLVIAFGAALLLLCLAILVAGWLRKQSLVEWANRAGDSRDPRRLLIRLLWPTADSSLRGSGLFWATAIVGIAVTSYGAIDAGKRKPAASAPQQAGAAPTPLLLVFPFSVEGAAADQRDALFADALTEEVTFGLGRFSTLRVMGRNSTSAVKASGADLATIRAKYGVNYVVHGTFRTAGDTFRLGLELIEAPSGVAIWSDVLQGPQTQVPTVSSEVVRAVVGRVALKIAKHDVRLATTAAGTNATLSAYELTLRARSLWNRPTPESLPQAQALLRQAAAADPAYAPALAYLAFTHLTSYNNSWSPGFAKPETLTTMLSLASQALELDPHNAIAHSARAIAYVYLGRHSEGQAAAREALKLNPNDPDTLGRAGQVLSFAGDHAGAITLLRQAVELDPFGPAQWFNFLSRAHLFMGDHDQAVAEAKNCLERANLDPCRENLAAALALSKRPGEAAAAWKEIVAKRGAVEPDQVISRMRAAFKNPQDPERLAAGLKLARDAAK